MTFGERFKKLRTDLRISKVALADLLGVTRNTIFKYEADVIFPSVSVMLSLVERFNISLDWLLTGHGEQYRAVSNAGGSAPDIILPEEKELVEFVRANPKYRTLFRKYMETEKAKSELHINEDHLNDASR